MKNTIISGVCAFAIVAGSAAAQSSAPAAENRAGLPASYRGPASAVAAIVDDTVITTLDVEQRMKMMLISAGGSISREMLPQLERQAVRDLVEEQLQLKEAKDYKLTPNPEDVNKQLTGMAASSGMTLPQFEAALKSEGVSMQSLRSQVGAGMVWPELVSGKFGKRVRVNDDEVDDTLARMREDATQEQFLVSEICLPVPEPSQAQAYYDGAVQLLEQMRKGVPFSVVAQQFSGCPTAAAGGDMGWVRAGELPNELDAAIRTLPPGAVTNPIPVENSFMIMALRDKRAAAKQGEKTWTLAYASVPASLGENAARLKFESLKAADVCGGRSQRQDLGAGVGLALIENVTLSRIDPRFRDAVDALQRGDTTPPIAVDDMLHAAYACEVDEGLGIPSRASIEDRIYQRELEKISQQYMRDIERKSTVDIRMGRTPAPQAQPAPAAPQG
jgi:peptidyl-prolyl cis-trans isomerase SurA